MALAEDPLRLLKRCGRGKEALRASEGRVHGALDGARGPAPGSAHAGADARAVGVPWPRVTQSMGGHLGPGDRWPE